jgi:hypothetical protein
MRKFLLSTFLFCFGATSLMAQLNTCKPDPKYKDSLFGVFPRPYDPIASPKGGIDKSACIGKPFQYVFTGVVPDTLEVSFFGQKIKVKIDSLVLDKKNPSTIVGLPKGISWNTPAKGGALLPKTQDCVVIFGTADNTNKVGDYDMKITMKAYFQTFIGPTTYDVSFPDPNLSPGKYTLKLEAATAKTCYAVGNEDQYLNVDKMAIFPNPTSDVSKIVFSAKEEDRFEFVVTDVNGRIYQRQNINVAAGWNEIPLDASNLANGVYFYYLGNQKGKIVEKLTVNR